MEIIDPTQVTGEIIGKESMFVKRLKGVPFFIP